MPKFKKKKEIWFYFLFCLPQGSQAKHYFMSSEKKKKEKKGPSLPLICASVCHARSNPGWNVSGRGVLRPRGTEQQVKLNSLRTCPASQLLQ